MSLTAYQAKYYAHELQRSYANDHVGKLAGLLFDAQVEPKPHQIDAALFALQTPYLPGVVLADEVGLGKTIEAGIVITQYWAERRRRILIIAPSSLRQQWQQEMIEKFLIPSQLLDPKLKGEQLARTAEQGAGVLICSYDFALRHEASLLRQWDLVICDEAHRLRNFYTGRNKAPEAISHIVREAHKTLLVTATPLQNRLEEVYGLVSVFDPDYFYSLDAFRERYVKTKGIGDNDDLVERVAAISKRTLRRDADKYIHFTKRLPLTVEFTPSFEEIELYEKVNDLLVEFDLLEARGELHGEWQALSEVDVLVGIPAQRALADSSHTFDQVVVVADTLSLDVALTESIQRVEVVGVKHADEAVDLFEAVL